MASKKDGQPLRLVAVLRVSQRKGREGPSFLAPGQQRSKINRWVADNNAVVVAWFDETDSVSGHNVTEKRPGLHLALDAIEKGEADGLIVAKIDRFARNLIDGLLTIRELKLAGKAFVAAENNINTANKSDQIARILIPFLLMLAEWEWEARRDGWLEARRSAVERGIAHRMPYGYEREGGKGQPVIVPEKAEVVRSIFAMRAAGRGWGEIADELNAQGVPSPHKSKQWVRQTVAHLARNRAYVGEMRSGEFFNPSAFPPIMERAEFDAVQAMQQVPNARKGNTMLLAGLLRCATCGGRMPSHGSYGAYRCGQKYTWGVCEKPAWVAREAIEEYVESELLDGLRAGTERPRKSDRDLREAQAAVDKAQAALDAFMASPTTARLAKKKGQAAVDEMASSFLDDLDAAEERLATVQESRMGIAVPKNLAVTWATMPAEERRALLAQLFPVIVVEPTPRPKARIPIGERVRLCRPADVKKLPELPGRHGAQRLVRLKVP